MKVAAIAMAVLLAVPASAKLVEVDKLRPSRPIKRVISGGTPTVEMCSNDNRHAGRMVLDLATGTLWICLGEARGWGTVDVKVP